MYVKANVFLSERCMLCVPPHPPGHMEKIYFARFHPLVKDIVMSASYDMTVRMWNLDTRSEVMQLQGHKDQVKALVLSKSVWKLSV